MEQLTLAATARTRRTRRRLLAALGLLGLAVAAPAGAASGAMTDAAADAAPDTVAPAPDAPSAFHIVIDPGHTPAQGGALGVRGVYEVVYNNRLAAQICAALKKAGFDAELTRSPEQALTLQARAQFANERHADLFLSVHHDSAQPQYLEKIQAGSLPAYRDIKPLSGYALFVSERNPDFAQSYAFAKLLGKEMRALGRAPSRHHGEPIKGENRTLLDPALGIYRYDDLVVLHETKMPAVLMETGVIVDPDDEAYVSNPANQQRIVQAVVSAVRQYVALRAAQRK